MEAKFVAVGDTHGDLYCLEVACRLAVKNGIDWLIQLGDWGYLWPGANAVKAVEDVLEQYNVNCAFIDGNHDWHEQLPFFYPHIVDGHDLYELPADRRQFWIRRGDLVRMDGVTFVGLGGAPSIDREQRRPGKTWWESEVITEADVERTLRHAGTPVDVLLTHDAPRLPPGIPPLADGDGRRGWFQPLADESVAAVRRVSKDLAPRLNLHGHYHVEYTDPGFVDYDGRKFPAVVGLAHNYARFHGQCMKLVHVTDEKIVIDGVDVTRLSP